MRPQAAIRAKQLSIRGGTREAGPRGAYDSIEYGAELARARELEVGRPEPLSNLWDVIIRYVVLQLVLQSLEERVSGRIPVDVLLLAVLLPATRRSCQPHA